MNRRDSVIALVAAAIAGSSSSARAQSQGSRKPFVIALLPDFMPQWAPWLKTITDGLQRLGRVEGRDYVFYRSGVFYGPDSQLALDRVLKAKPDIILVVNLGYAVQAHKLTKTIPIVLLMAGFPVEAGVANSLARPGKNVTGMTIYASAEYLGKLVQLLHEVRPGARRMAVLMTYVPPFHPQAETDYFISGLRSAAGSLGIDLRVFEIASPEQIDATLAAVTAQQPEALVLTSGISIPPSRRQDILEFAAARHLPTIADAAFTSTGPDRPLLTYSASYLSLMEKAVPYIDQILWHGVKPGDLPIQLPARFEFVVNLKTAKTIGITVPPSILVRADKEIE
jgi:putative ABC transport system substrate-binding protein